MPADWLPFVPVRSGSSEPRGPDPEPRRGTDQTCLRLQKRVLDALRGEGPSLDKCGRGQRGIGVAADNGRAREQVVTAGMHAGRVRSQRGVRGEHAGQLLVVHPDPTERLAGMPLGVGSHRGQDVADAVRHLAFGHEQGPVSIDQALVPFARHVGGGDDADNARLPGGLRRVDAQDAGARVRREEEAASQHAVHAEVVDERAIAKRQAPGVLAGQTAAERPAVVGLRQRLARERPRRGLDGVDDLHVAGAAADVVVQRFGDLAARRRRVRVDQALRGHHDPGGTKAALEAARHREGVGEDVPCPGIEALQGDDVSPGGRAGGHDAGRQRPAIDQHGAAAARTLGRAAVLGRDEARLVAKHLHQRHAVLERRRERRAVEREVDLAGRVFGRHALTPRRRHWRSLPAVRSTAHPAGDGGSYTWTGRLGQGLGAGR